MWVWRGFEVGRSEVKWVRNALGWSVECGGGGGECHASPYHYGPRSEARSRPLAERGIGEGGGGGLGRHVGLTLTCTSTQNRLPYQNGATQRTHLRYLRPHRGRRGVSEPARLTGSAGTSSAMSPERFPTHQPPFYHRLASLIVSQRGKAYTEKYRNGKNPRVAVLNRSVSWLGASESYKARNHHQ